MAIPVDPFISSAIDLLLRGLDSLLQSKLASRGQVNRKLEEWRRILPKIRATAKDIEQKQLSNEGEKIWLMDLQDIIYDAEDILDEFSTDASLNELRRQQQQTCSSNVRHKTPGFLASLNPKGFIFNSKMVTRINDITNRMQQIVTHKKDFDSGNENSTSNSFKRLPGTCLLDETAVRGREDEKEEFIKLLLSNEGCDQPGVCVIPLVGMGGVGKTTLAQLVYNDKRVTQSFDARAWSWVSEDFDVFRVTKTILEAITSVTCDAGDFNILQVSLRDSLVGKKVLIVLDDVWNESYHDWTFLRTPFQATSHGSKIIVTARNHRVAEIMGTVPSYPLKELTFEASLSLFARHALGRENFDGHLNLKEIGEQIVQRCKGLPLALKALGGLLRSNTDHKDWENVLQSKMWDSPEDKIGVLPVLKVSYYHLPYQLKQLFAFCSIFPKGYEFYQEELILLWMGEGFLSQPGGKKHMEDLDSCFKEFVSRSFFQHSISNKSLFMMHDLISDLAQSVAGERCIHLNSYDKLEDDQRGSGGAKTRHLSFTHQKYEVSLRFKNLSKLKHLRTLIALPLHASPCTVHCYLSNSILNEVLLKLRRLRVLSLNGYRLREIPTSIGGLKLLRYLDLSRTTIKCLPESVCTLINLQTLILSGCKELVKLPQDIGNLINLCHLDIADTDLQEMPLQIGKLTSLRNLPKYILEKDNGCVLGELKELKNLQGELSILGLHNLADAQQASDADLRSKQSLVKLELQWSENFQDSRDPAREMRVLEFLQPHTNLKELKVSFYAGSELPNWMGDTSFANMVNLRLSSCRNCASLPPLGTLTSLRALCIERMDAVEKVSAFCGSSSSSVMYFPSLERLEFKDMLHWKHWFSHAEVEVAGDKFPRLRELALQNCPNLIGELPRCFPSLEKLTIINCPLLLGESQVSLPSLHELAIEECNEVVLRSMVDVTSLTTLEIWKMSELTCLGDWPLLSSKALKTLVIRDCSNLTFLFAQNRLENSLGLEELEIEDCPSLKFLRSDKLPSTMKRFKINNCRKLQALPEGIMHNDNSGNISQLEHLEIINCPSLTSFPAGKFPIRLKTLKIWDCLKLEPLSERKLHDDSSLEHIDIWNYGILTGLLECHNGLRHLTGLRISSSSRLHSFPEAGLSLPKLAILKIYYCDSLKSLPKDMRNLTSLQELIIQGCKELEFSPEWDLPFNLTYLEIWNCGLDGTLSEWNLQRLTSLRDFSIAGGFFSDIVCFPGKKFRLPTSLVSLYIGRLPKLEDLSTEIQTLTSLVELQIVECPKLRSLPRKCLPPTLGKLTIRESPLCLKKKGTYSSLKTLIPLLETDTKDA